MELGVICDGISRDLRHAVNVMDEYDLKYAELQFIGENEVGDLSAAEVREVDQLLRDRGKPVSCLSRHVFAGMTGANKPGDELHIKHMDALKRVMEMAHTVGAPLVRIMTPKKEQILWGRNGAEKWNVAHGAWDGILPLIAPAVELARQETLTLVVETGNGTMVNSNFTARKLIDDLGAKGVLKVLWDPANNCWCHERAFPEGYREVADGYLGHIHIKDVFVDTPRATLEVRQMGKGQLAPLFEPMANALRQDGYSGVVSFESVYHPGNGDFEAGFRANIDTFKALFGGS
ncbi:putative xylose isomerase domain-containing protein [Roseibium sp. TrichSKD4]|uniref:sugar phosphate isomerase/epimerase family protein n=1 Tax=Roseibium sp. TrichSKD4 TaxID=744980 RepID=UPI0001E56F25|nr:sugar phosphate isomerase/epimerase family protein [Roseibium sp. TrichSKD4]EFO32082.1 putative xylose isomerase domain-containing protein [Roseibium sp. TrichSKD4]